MKPGVLVAGRFLIEACVASSANGAVARATDAHDGQRVALKWLAARGAREGERAEGEASMVARFDREARALAGLRDEGVVRYVAHGEADGGRFLVTEWLEGETLEARLERGPMPPREALEVAWQVARALGHAHERGVVHRDVKPSNVMLVAGSSPRAVLIDFGVARLDHGGAPTHAGETLGTPGYMAPEQARGAHDVDGRADVFALGCMLFEGLTGRPAFGGAHVMAILAKVLLEEAPRVSEAGRSVPSSVESLVARMLSKDPAGRPIDGADAAAQIAAVLADVPVEARFSTMGPLLGPTSTSWLTRQEQRLVCVLMWGAGWGVGGASRARAEEARAALEGHGVHAEVLVDGSVVGTVTAQGDVAAQVARAAGGALELARRWRGEPVVLATGRGVLRGRLPVGEVIDRGATMVRAEAMREAGRRTRGEASEAAWVRVDEATAGLLGTRFVVRGDDEGLWLASEREALGGPRRLLGRATNFVGRDAEVGKVLDEVRGCFRAETPRAAVVYGVSGAGKSRLLHEVVARLRDEENLPEVWAARGEPMGRGAPFGLIGQMLRREAQLLESEPESVKQQKLVGRMGRHLEASEARRAARFLGELVGANFDDRDDVQLRAARGAPMVMSAQLRRSWGQWVAAEAGARPLLIAIDDAHWGDLSSMTYLAEAIAVHAGRRLFVLAALRPDAGASLPTPWADLGAVEVELGGLATDAATRLVREALGEGVSDAQVAALVEQAGGNAFFLEELIRAAASGEGGGVPASVLAMVQARLEALSSEARRALRAASVFGSVFWPGGVEAMLGAPGGASADALLGELERAELITRREGCRYAGQGEFEFRDAPVREAAYETLTDRDRAAGHVVAADWLESVGERNAVVLAEHHERGGRLARARAGFLAAARDALEGNDVAACVRWADRAERCEGDDVTLGQLRLLRAEANRFTGKASTTERWALSAMQLLVEGSDDWLRAAAEAVEAAGQAGHPDVVTDLAARVAAHAPPEGEGPSMAFVAAASRCALHLVRLGRATQADDLLRGLGSPGEPPLSEKPEVAAWLLLARAMRAGFVGHPGAQLTLLRAAVSAFDRAGDARAAWTQRGQVGAALAEVGEGGEAELLLGEVVTAARAIGLGEVEAQAKTTLALVLGRRAAIAEARATGREAVAFFSGRRSKRPEGVARTHLAMVLLLGGDAVGARKEAERAVAALAACPPPKALAQAVLARALLATGDPAQALAPAVEALEALQALGGVDEGEATIRLSHARALLATGAREDGERAAFEAERRLLDRAARIDPERTRQLFLRSITDHAATLRLAADLREGRQVDAPIEVG